MQIVALHSRRNAFRGTLLEAHRPQITLPAGLKAHADPLRVVRLPLQATKCSHYKFYIQESGHYLACKLLLYAPDGTLSEGRGLSLLSRKKRSLRGLKAHADPFGVVRLPLQATESSTNKTPIHQTGSFVLYRIPSISQTGRIFRRLLVEFLSC